MKFGFSREVLPPFTRVYRAALPYMLAATGICVASFAAYKMAPHLRPVTTIDVVSIQAPAMQPAPTPAVVAMPAPVVIETAAPAPEPAPVVPTVPVDASGAAFNFVVNVDDATYMLLGDGKDVKRTDVKIVGEWKQAAIANIDMYELPVTQRKWMEQEVIVDSSCRATVEGFVVLARLTGDPGYAGDVTEWNETTLFEHGNVQVAARLSGCVGTYARDARLDGIVAMTTVDNASAVAAARADFFESKPMKAAAKEFAKDKYLGNLDESNRIHVKSVRHPTTGTEWISIHAAADLGCGDLDVNYVGLYRVQKDGSVKRVLLDKLSDTSRIEHLVDLNGDGRLERVVSDWLGTSSRLESFDGTVHKTLDTPFFGCPC